MKDEATKAAICSNDNGDCKQALYPKPFQVFKPIQRRSISLSMVPTFETADPNHKTRYYGMTLQVGRKCHISRV